MLNISVIDAQTQPAIDAGVRQFQAFLCASTDEEHARRLLYLMQLPDGAVVVDAGCGIGETARLMRNVRPDLRFILVNLSQSQLDLCPEDMERHCADFCAMPVADGSVDAVFYSHSACQCRDWCAMLEEARRVLGPEGRVFIHEVADVGGADRAAWLSVGAVVRTADDMALGAMAAGFVVTDCFALERSVNQLSALGAPYLARGTDCLFLTLEPVIDPIERVMMRHEHIAFQFSGGRDSTAALYLMRDWWQRMTVYHLDTGDHFPETTAVVTRVARDVLAAGGHFKRVHSDAAADRAKFGMPTDLLPVDNCGGLGRMVSGQKVLLQSRYECCWRSLMAPMHQQLMDDGITLVVRGQRDEDYAQPPMRSGQAAQGLEVFYPIQSWTTAQVDAYIKANGLPLAAWYDEGASHGSDCMGCTAWWDDGRASYMKRVHPGKYADLRANLGVIRQEINRQIVWLNAMEI